MVDVFGAQVGKLRRVWTFDDLQQLALEDWRGYEIVDGALVVTPSPGLRHEFVSADVRAVVAAALPDGLRIIGPMAVDLAPSYRIPDLIVVPQRLSHSSSDLAAPVDVVLVIEIVSPGSVTTDRVTKPAQYAAAGIGAYWRVEIDPVSITVYELPAGASAYVEAGTWGAGETARIRTPFEVAIEVDRLG